MTQRLILFMCIAWLSFSGNVLADSGLIAPGATLEVVHHGGQFYEGASWSPFLGRLYFTSLTANELLTIEPSQTATVWLNNTQSINGTYLDSEGRLLAAQGEARNIVRFEEGFDGPLSTTVLAHNAAWFMPNDLCQTPQGHIYFTTPAFSGGNTSWVYHLAPNGTVSPAVTDMTIPNGVMASNDGTWLYVGDSSVKTWRRYPIFADGSVGSGALFFDPGISNRDDPDGMTIDEFGNLYLNGRGGLWIVSPAGETLEFIDIPVFNTNATFGGYDGKTLFITGDGYVYQLRMNVRGAWWRDVPLDNQPPTVDESTLIKVMSQDRDGVVLPLTASDDYTSEADLRFYWVQLEGPAVVLSDPRSQSPTVSLQVPGVYRFRVIVSDGAVPVSVQVEVDFRQVGDYDKDNDVDTDDQALFALCELVPNVTPTPMCLDRDIDHDNDVDQSDFGLFQRCLSGSGGLTDPACADAD